MTTFLNRSHAGDDVYAQRPEAVRVAAVWEPSGFNEGAAAERGVRTLRPLDRTQGRGGLEGLAMPPYRQGNHASRLQETILTYLLGALLGLAVVVAALVGTEGESGAVGEVSSVGTQQQPGSAGR